MSSRLIGAHMPSQGGIGGSIRGGKEIGCTAVQVFTSSPRMWNRAPADPGKVKDFQSALVETKIDAVVSHDSYLINLADPKPEGREKSMAGLIGEMNRCGAYGIPHVVSHVGAHMGAGVDEGLKRAADGIAQVLASTPDSVTLLMETTAGQGTCLNYQFSQIEELLNLTGRPNRLGICLDTCHVFAAGYDIRTESGYKSMWQEFEERIGIGLLKVIHCNDSKKPMGSRVDRHENLGEGEIGPVAFQCLMQDSRFFQVPIVVETPIENDGHRKNVEKLWAWSRAGG